MNLLYEIASFGIAIFIVLFSSLAVYYGICYLSMTKLKKRFDWIVLMQTTISMAWLIIFGYIIEETIRFVPPVVVGSFGSLFIRPVILLSSAAVSIWMFIRYKFEKSGRNDIWNLQKN